MSDEKAKAVQAVAKAVEKGLDSVDKVGGFFSRVFGQPIEDTVGVYWGDNIRAKRIERAIDLTVKVQKKLKDAGIVDIRPITEKIGLPLIENATLEDDPILKEMYANLLFNAINPESSEIDIQYVNTLKALTKGDILLFETIFSGALPPSEPISLPSLHEGVGTPPEKMLRRKDMLLVDGVAEKNILHLKELGLLKPATIWVKFGLNSAMATPISRDPFDFELTEYAEEFAQAVRKK